MRLPLSEEILRRLGRRGSPFASLAQASEAPYMPSEVPTDDPRLGVDMRAQELPLARPPQLPVPRPPMNVAPPRPRSADLQDEITTLDAGPSRKGTLLKALAQAGTIGAGALFGGSVGASGAAGGVEQFNAAQDEQRQLQRKSLAADLEAQRQREFQAEQSGLSRQASAAQSQSKLEEDMRQFNETQARIREEGAANRENQQQLLGMKNESAQDIATIKTQADADYKKAQTELAEARRQTEIAKANPNSPIYRMAQERLATAERNAETARIRLGLSQQQFEMRAFGTNQGQPLPGAMITDEGQTVGSTFSQNVRPTGQERNKGDLAASAHEQISSMKDIVTRRKDIFGPAAGRTTEFSVWVGSQDPDAQRFRAARTIAGDHLAGVFGGRSEAALDALDSAIGHFKDNPEAVMAGLDQLDQANDRFMKAGTVKTVGSNAAPKKAAPGSLIKAVRPPLSSFEKKGP